MAYQQKEGQGSLFKNDKQNDRQPDFRGSIMIKGVLYEVAGWSRTSQNGREYISLQAQEPDPNRQAGRQGGANGASSYGQQGGWQQAPQPAPAPAPTMDDFPGAEPVEDLPF